MIPQNSCGQGYQQIQVGALFETIVTFAWEKYPDKQKYTIPEFFAAMQKSINDQLKSERMSSNRYMEEIEIHIGENLTFWLYAMLPKIDVCCEWNMAHGVLSKDMLYLHESMMPQSVLRGPITKKFDSGKESIYPEHQLAVSEIVDFGFAVPHLPVTEIIHDTDGVTFKIDTKYRSFGMVQKRICERFGVPFEQ